MNVKLLEEGMREMCARLDDENISRTTRFLRAQDVTDDEIRQAAQPLGKKGFWLVVRRTDNLVALSWAKSDLYKLGENPHFKTA